MSEPIKARCCSFVNGDWIASVGKTGGNYEAAFVLSLATDGRVIELTKQEIQAIVRFVRHARDTCSSGADAEDADQHPGYAVPPGGLAGHENSGNDDADEGVLDVFNDPAACVGCAE